MEAAPAPPPSPAPVPAGQRRRWAWVLALAVGALLLMLALLLAGGWQALRTEAGTAWLLSQVRGLKITGGRGSLSGGPFSAARVEFELEGSPVRVRIDGLAWRDLAWHWRPYAGAWTGLVIEGLQAQRVEVHTLPGEPMRAPPTSLRLPFELHLPGARVQLLQVNDGVPLRELHASVHLGTDRGRQHRIDQLSFEWDRSRWQGQATLGADAPLPLRADAEGRAVEAPGATGPWATPWTARLQAQGPLDRIAVQGRLRSEEAAGAASLDLQAELLPFAPWPLGALNAQMQQLDLAALFSGAPQTRLHGRAVTRSEGMDRPAQVDLDLRNALPGRWDEQRLPVRSLRLDLRARPDQPRQVELQRFDLQLGHAGGGAGQWTGSGRWNGDRLALDTRLVDLQPNDLDRRAPRWRVSGPVQGSYQPSRDGWQVDLKAALTGRAEPGGATVLPPMALSAGLRVVSGREGLAMQLSEAEARAGEARAQGDARLQRDHRSAGWQIHTRGQLQQFDPLLWWPGAEGSAWRRGGHRLNGRWQAELTAAQGTDWRRWRGRVNLALADSRVAGVPLEAELQWTGDGSPGGRLQARVQAATARADARGSLGGRDTDSADLSLDAPDLAAIAPLLQLMPQAADWAPTAGRLTLQAQLQGHGASLRLHGEAQASELRSPTLTLGAATARWRFGQTPDAPLELQASGERLTIGALRIDRLRLEGNGTTGAHHLLAEADTSLKPPVWTDALIGSAGGTGSQLRLQAQGGWRQTADGGRWQGELQQLRAAGRQAREPWLLAEGVRAELGLDRQGRLQWLQAEPGRLRLFDAALRWTAMRWQMPEADGRPRVDVQAELEPLPVAPLLTRLQPAFGWGGDLRLKGHVRLQTGADFSADVVLERAGGDLSVTEEGDTQFLGLTDLRLGWFAQQGVWHFTQALAGSHVGVLAGAQSLRLPARSWWPAKDTPMEGVLELRVDNLGVWGAWTPPGWRLSGRLHTSASIGGRFGAPEYIGQIEGQGLGVRHLLHGVNITDGEVRIALKGPTAQIEHFLLKGGDGVLRLEGGASFGDDPRAQLRLNAGRFQVLGRVDRRIVASGQAEMTLARDSAKLDGRVIIDEGLIDFTRADAPTLDDDVTVVRRAPARPGTSAESAQAAAAPPTPRPPRAVRATLDVDLGEQLRLRGRGLDAVLRGQLRMTTPGNRLAVHGTVRTDQGTYAAYGQRLQIERGLVSFTGPVENPRLDIVALRPNLDVRVGVAVGGTAIAPRVRLFSEPEMTDAEKLSWLVLGRAPEGLGRADTALLQRAAMALLSGEGQSTPDKVLQTLGIDEFSVRQEGEGELRNTVVALGKQLSQRWYLGYERGLNSTTGTWQLIYRIAQRFTLRGQAGEDNAIDLIWSWRW